MEPTTQAGIGIWFFFPKCPLAQRVNCRYAVNLKRLMKERNVLVRFSITTCIHTFTLQNCQLFMQFHMIYFIKQLFTSGCVTSFQNKVTVSYQGRSADCCFHHRATEFCSIQFACMGLALQNNIGNVIQHITLCIICICYQLQEGE